MFEYFKLSKQLKVEDNYKHYQLTDNIYETVSALIEQYKNTLPAFVDTLKNYLNLGEGLFIYSDQPEWVRKGTETEFVRFHCYRLELDETFDLVRLKPKNEKVVIVNDGKWLKSYTLVYPLTGKEVPFRKDIVTTFHTLAAKVVLIDTNCTMSQYSCLTNHNNLLTGAVHPDTRVYFKNYFRKETVNNITDLIEDCDSSEDSVRFFFDGYFFDYEMTHEVVDLINEKCSFVECKNCGVIFPITDATKNWYASRKLSMPKRCSVCRGSHKKETSLF